MNNFEQQSKMLLNCSEQQISPEDSQALGEIRARAIQQPLKSRLPSFLAPTVGMLAASLVTLAIMSPTFFGDGKETNGTETAEFYQDLEFYYWLAAEQSNQR